MKVRTIAHRGFSGRYPENTLLAFQKAVELGVDEVEFDVKNTSDGYPVIMHDENVDRTTNGTGSIFKMTLKEVKKLDAGIKFGKRFKGIEVPTLKEALSVIPEKVELNIHIYPDNKLVEKVMYILLEQNRIENVYLAIESRLISTARDIYPDVRICNMSRQHNSDAYIEEAKKWNCERVQFFSPAYEVTKEMIEKAHLYGLFVNVFFADTEEEMKKYIDYGADAILTNYPDILLSVLKNYKK